MSPARVASRPGAQRSENGSGDGLELENTVVDLEDRLYVQKTTEQSLGRSEASTLAEVVERVERPNSCMLPLVATAAAVTSSRSPPPQRQLRH